MQTCPFCHATTRQNKAGQTQSGSQRYRCMHCFRKYTPMPKHHGYPESLRQQARDMYMDGSNFRRIARYLNVHHRTISLWVNDQTHSQPKEPIPEDVKDTKMNELLTFIGDKELSSTT